MYLDVRLADGSTGRIEVEDRNTLDQELELLLNRDGRYATGWIPLKGGREFVRYEQIVSVRPVGPRD